MSEQIYIIETLHDGLGTDPISYLNREPDPSWSEAFDHETILAGAALELQDDRIVLTGTPTATPAEIVERVNLQVNASEA